MELRGKAGPLAVGSIMGLLVGAVVGRFIESQLVFLVLVLTLPAFMVGLLANGSAHNSNGFVWAIGAAAQWAWITHFLIARGKPQAKDGSTPRGLPK